MRPSVLHVSSDKDCSARLLICIPKWGPRTREYALHGAWDFLIQWLRTHSREDGMDFVDALLQFPSRQILPKGVGYKSQICLSLLPSQKNDIRMIDRQTVPQKLQ